MILQNTGRRLDVAGEAVQRVVRNGVGIAPHLPRASCFPLVPAGDVDERGVYRKGVLPLFGKVQPVRDGVLAAVGTVGVGIAASEYVIPCVHGSQTLAGRPVLRYRDAHLLHRVGSLAHHLCLRVDGDPFPCRIVAMPVVGHKLDAVTALVRQDEVILGGVAGIDYAEGEEFLRIGALLGTELRGIAEQERLALPAEPQILIQPLGIDSVIQLNDLIRRLIGIIHIQHGGDLRRFHAVGHVPPPRPHTASGWRR